MSCYCNRPNCLTVAAVVSAVIGVVVALLRITGVITVTPTLLAVTFGIAVLYLAVMLLRGGQTYGCCGTVNAVLAGILGTLFFSALLVAVPFAATSIIGAVLTGILAAFFVLIFIASVCLIQCVDRCDG